MDVGPSDFLFANNLFYVQLFAHDVGKHSGKEVNTRYRNDFTLLKKTPFLTYLVFYYSKRGMSFLQRVLAALAILSTLLKIFQDFLF